MKKRVRCLLLLLTACLLVFSTSAYARSKEGWVKEKEQWRYYTNGKKSKGLTRIGQKYYYFTKKGNQGTSWRKIDGAFYFFKTGRRSNAYMLKNTKKNGIKLGRDGKAILSSKRAKKKVKMMAAMSEYLDPLIKSSWSKKKKLTAVYDYMRRYVPYKFTTHFREKDKNWDIWCANKLLKNGYADCHPFACAFSYLANAIGYRNVIIESAKTHSWTRIGDEYYDVCIGRHNLRNYALFARPKDKFMVFMIERGHKEVKVSVYLDML